MDESDFKGTITGEVRWAMNGDYCYFHPHDLPYEWMCSRESLNRMRDASTELARLDGMLKFIDPDTVRMLTENLSLMESASSSSIEGTRSTVDDVFRSEKMGERDEVRLRDNQEIVNYRRALLTGFERLPVGGTVTIDLILDLHRILMDGVRGSDKSPGEFKTHQNAIGNPGDTIDTAKMVPACPESVDRLLDNWLDYVNSDRTDTVEKVIVSHYQFEAIHPFRDGNGRIGRLLMLLVLRRDGLLTHPALYLSGYLNNHRNRYIDLLYEVSAHDALDDWIGFLSDGLLEQSRSTAATVEALIRYRDRLRESARDINEHHAIDLLFGNPYVKSTDIVEKLGVSPPTANKILTNLESDGIVREVTGRKRNRLYLADGVMDLLR